MKYILCAYFLLTSFLVANEQDGQERLSLLFRYILKENPSRDVVFCNVNHDGVVTLLRNKKIKNREYLLIIFPNVAYKPVSFKVNGVLRKDIFDVYRIKLNDVGKGFPDMEYAAGVYFNVNNIDDVIEITFYAELHKYSLTYKNRNWRKSIVEPIE